MAKRYDDLNSVLLEGVLKSDPTEYTTGITKHCRLELENNCSHEEKDGTYKITTTTIQIRMFDLAGMMCLQHLKKGSIVRIRGEIKEDRYIDKKGLILTKTYVKTNHIEFKHNSTLED